MKKWKIFRWILLILFIGWVWSSYNFLTFPKKQYARSAALAPYDVIIVPGFPYPDTSGKHIIQARILWARYLLEKGITKNVIFSGGAVYTPYFEGVAMKIIADSMGFPPEHTFAETRAEHSTENVWYGMRLAKKMGFKKIALATDPFQAWLMRRFIDSHCRGMENLPMSFEKLDSGAHPMPLIDPAGALDTVWPGPLTKRESRSERFQGTLGHHINFNEKE